MILRGANAAKSGSLGGPLSRVMLRGTAWSLLSRLLGQGMVLVSTVVLARVLSRDDFGVAAYAITLIAIFGSVPALGLGPALIVHGRDERSLSTGFWLGLVAGVLGFMVVWLLAPMSTLIFEDERAVDVTRALGLVFPIESLRSVHGTVLSRRLAFRSRVVPELVQALVKGIASIWLAFTGWGAMALIAGTLAGALASVPAYWVVSGWRPRHGPNLQDARRLLGYGGHVVGTNVLGATIRNLDYLVIGRVLGATALGLYVIGFRLPDLLVRQLCRILSQVLLPVYARLGRSPEELNGAFEATLRYLVALTAPISIGMALVARPAVEALFGVDWIDAASIVTPIAIYTLLISVSFNVGDAFKALDRPDLLMRLSVFRGLLAVPTLIGAAVLTNDVTAVAWAQAAIGLCSMGATLTVGYWTFRLPVAHALMGIAPVLGACAVMSASVLSLRIWLGPVGCWVELAALVPTGAIVYVAALRVLAPEFVDTGWEALRDALSRRRQLAQESA